MRLYYYQAEIGIIKEKSLTDLQDKHDRERGLFWIDVEGSEFETEVNKVGKVLNLHPLTIEDTLTPESRPIMDTFPDYLYILARVPPEDWEIGEMDTSQLSLVISGDYLLTFHRKNLPPVEKIAKRITNYPQRYFEGGIDYLSYRILDQLVDNYFPVLDKLEEKIERVEDKVLTEPDEGLLTQITDLRSDLIEIQRATSPQREMVAKLSRPDTPFIDDERKIYFRDIQDDLARISDLLTNYRELIGGARDTYMTVISNRMNEIMQTLTIVATIFIPLTFIAGVYGMNFDFMPELGWEWGYFGALGVMGTTALGMIYYFKKEDWF